MARFVKFAFALGGAIASGNSLREREIHVPAAVKSTTATKAKTGKGSLKLRGEVSGSAKTGKGFSSEKTTPVVPVTPPDSLNDMLKFEGNDMTGLWEGRDFPEQRLPMEVLAPDDGMEAARNVHIFGLQDSGTSLLKAYLYTNFGHRLNYFDGAFQTNTKPNQRKGLWKHSSFKLLGRVESGKVHSLNEAEVHSISVVRNPYSWLQAVRTGRTTFWMDCIQGDDWLIKPCSHSSPGGPDSTIDGMDFQSVAGIWNHWNEGFKNAQDYGFNRTLVVKYEDLVQQPREVLTQIRDFLELEKWGNWTIPFEGKAEKLEVVQALNSGSFMNSFIQREKQQACKHLDPDVVKLLHYPVFDCSQFTKGPALMHKSE